MLRQWCEVLSPTLFDENVYYGRLSDIEVTNSGEDYDVINPPELEIVDSQGTGCKAHVNVSGSVQEIKVLKAVLDMQQNQKFLSKVVMVLVVF